MLEREGKFDPLARLRDSIDNANMHLEDEYNRIPTNTWVDCFGTRVATVKLLFSEVLKRDMLSTEEISKAQENLKRLEVKYAEMRKDDPEKSSRSPNAFSPEAKQEILNMLKILD